MNQYLKDVAKACGIEKNITFHERKLKVKSLS